MKATRTIELAKGVTVTVTSELYEYRTEGDAWEGRVGEHEIWIESRFGFEMNGKKTDGLIYRERDVTFDRNPNIPKDAEATISGNGLLIGLRHDNAEKVRKAIEETREEVTTDEARAFFEEKEEKALEAKNAKARSIVKEAEKIIADGGKLRTNKERAEWERNYNNAVNEGGEGYVPHYPSVEEYEEAKEILKK